MKNLNNRGIQQNFYKIVSSDFEVTLDDEFTISVYESREPLSKSIYKYEDKNKCAQDLTIILAIKNFCKSL